MLTTIKSKKNVVKKATVKKAGTTKQDAAAPAVNPVIAAGELKNVAIATIDFSPLNYRKFYSQTALDDFAAELALHGIISPLTLRSMPNGRYELVAGERRLRAAQLAGLTEVPAVIKVLTDAEVTEIQLAENLQRENPHPMNEAQAIGLMKHVYKTVDAIAARLGKSKNFVYSRVRLLDLIAPIQEMFFADAFTIQEAFDIAALSAESQQEFFNQYCTNWATEQDFKINNLRYALSRFKYDLKNAPFNTKDKKLVPEMGACTNCPFNSATLKSLFPELAEQAICTKKDCYQSKCNAHFTRLFSDAFKEHQPQAIIYDWVLSDTLKNLLDTIPGADTLPRHSRNEVMMMNAPTLPEKEDFINAPDAYDDEEGFEEEEDYSETGEEPQVDEAGYNAALYEYEADMEEYSQLIASGSLSKGLLISETKAVLVTFSLGGLKGNDSKIGVTAKEVQEAVKSGTATPELLQAEIDRINSREQRAKELDMEKIQLTVHAAFMEGCELNNIVALTNADLVAARLLVYHSLDWSARNKVNSVLFSEKAKDDAGKELPFYDVLQNLTEQQYSYLIRMAIGHNSESKLPTNATGKIMLKVAEGAGVDIPLIERAQQEKADGRRDKLTVRIAELEQKIQVLNRTQS